jgi:hypothetical protein
MGVEVQLGAMVVDVDEHGIEVKEKDGTTRRIEARTKIWAAGVAASPLGEQLAEQSGAELDRSGRVQVNRDLTLPGHPEVYVVGDMMGLDRLPGVSPVAIQGAKHAAKSITARAKGERGDTPFKYFDKGSMATISRFRAVASIGRIRLRGFPAWVAWLVVHLLYLTAFKNRLTALMHWSVSFVGRGRSERTATLQQVVARNQLQRISHDKVEDRGSLGQTSQSLEGLSATDPDANTDPSTEAGSTVPSASQQIAGQPGGGRREAVVAERLPRAAEVAPQRQPGGPHRVRGEVGLEPAQQRAGGLRRHLVLHRDVGGVRPRVLRREPGGPGGGEPGPLRRQHRRAQVVRHAPAQAAHAHHLHVVRRPPRRPLELVAHDPLQLAGQGVEQRHVRPQVVALRWEVLPAQGVEALLRRVVEQQREHERRGLGAAHRRPRGGGAGARPTSGYGRRDGGTAPATCPRAAPAAPRTPTCTPGPYDGDDPPRPAG